MNQNDTIWRNCTNEELLKTLEGCPEVVEEMKKIGYNDMVNSYDALLPKYNIDRMTIPVCKEGTDEVEYFGYWYSIDGTQHDSKEICKTKAEAQLAAVRETMYELQKRIKAKKNPYYN